VSFAKRAESARGAINIDDLHARLRKLDVAADSELTAIHVIRSGNMDTNLEIGPAVAVGERLRRPDFRIAKPSEPWTHVEVTRLHASNASERADTLVGKLATELMDAAGSFVIELVLWRIPSEQEIEDLVACARLESASLDPRQIEVSDLAWIVIKPCADPSVVVPTVLPKGDGPRIGRARALIGPGQPNRQVVIRMPYSDQRAEDVLNAEAKQLPKDTSGLIMVDVSGQPSVLNSWDGLAQHRFTPRQHTRVGGVILFMYAVQLTTEGLTWLPQVKLIRNPHAVIPIPAWIPETIDALRDVTKSLTGRPD